MDERETDPRLLMLILSVMQYLEAKKEPVNPFVSGFGISEKVQEADDFMFNCLEACIDYFPEVSEMLEVMDADEPETTNLPESQIQ